MRENCPKCGGKLNGVAYTVNPVRYGVICPACGWERIDGLCGEVKTETIMTNGQKIRQMTDEELANQLVSEQYVAMKMVLTLLYQKLKDEEILDEKDAKEGFCDFENEVKKKWGEMVKEKLEWLKNPVEGEG